MRKPRCSPPECHLSFAKRGQRARAATVSQPYAKFSIPDREPPSRGRRALDVRGKLSCVAPRPLGVTLFRAFRPEELTHFLRFFARPFPSAFPRKDRDEAPAFVRRARSGDRLQKRPLHRSRVGHDNGKTPTSREVARHIPRTMTRARARARPSSPRVHRFSFHRSS